MFAIAIAAALSAQAPAEAQPVAADRRALAVVRILRPAIVRLGKDGGTQSEGAVVRESLLRTSDGSGQRLSLVEFY